MPTITINISNVKENNNGSSVSFTATDTSNKVIERTLQRSDINSWPEFAEWLINQDKPDYRLLPDKEVSLEITFHNETEVDPESGEEIVTRLVDGVVVT